jgi:hypothetical protein
MDEKEKERRLAMLRIQLRREMERRKKMNVWDPETELDMSQKMKQAEKSFEEKYNSEHKVYSLIKSVFRIGGCIISAALFVRYTPEIGFMALSGSLIVAELFGIVEEL